MAYQMKRAERVREVLELLNTDGSIAATINVDLDVDKTASEFNKRYNAVIVAENAVRGASVTPMGETVQMTQEQVEAANAAFEAFGIAIQSLFSIVFGDEDTAKLLKFFEGKYYEMSMQVVPFLVDVVLPSMKSHLNEQRARMAENYKVAQQKGLR